MSRLSYVIGLAYIAVCAGAVAAARPEPVRLDHPRPVLPAERPPADPAQGGAAAWFGSVKPFCNALEVETALAREPAPPGTEGAGYQAACLALGGKIDRARTVIQSVAGAERARAAGIVFEVAHPVADQGDDRSAGPIMALVVEFWPNHTMALYHAGVSEAVLGDRSAAIRHLEAFVRLYPAEDGWRAQALRTLGELGR